MEPGRPADLVLVDPGMEWTIDAAAFILKGRNTPFHGEKVRGRVVRTMVGGRTVWRLGDGS